MNIRAQINLLAASLGVVEQVAVVPDGDIRVSAFIGGQCQSGASEAEALDALRAAVRAQVTHVHECVGKELADYERKAADLRGYLGGMTAALDASQDG